MKHRFFGGAGSRVFPACRSSHSLCLPANEKDFSLSLEMTNACEAVFRLLPLEGGGPKGRRLASQRTESRMREAAFSYRHPERSRGIFFVCRVPFAVWSGLHETPFFRGGREQGVSRLPLLSHPLPCRERKRFLVFARNDECGGGIFSPFLRRGGGWHLSGMKVVGEERFP